MRTIYIICLVIVIFCLCFSHVYAGGIGNPVKPLGHMNFAVTAEGNFIFDRDMASGGSSTSGSIINTMELSSVTQGYVKCAVGITDYVNLFAKAGTAKINGLDINFSTGENVEIESDNNLFYGIGASLVYQIHSDEIYFVDVESEFIFFWGIMGEFNYFKPDADEMYIDGAGVTNVSGYLESEQYQAGLFTGIEIPLDENASFIPYIGGLWTQHNIKTGGVRYNTDILNFDSDSDDEFGGVLGLDIKLSENVTFNAESRFYNGHEISVGGTIKF